MYTRMGQYTHMGQNNDTCMRVYLNLAYAAVPKIMQATNGLCLAAAVNCLSLVHGDLGEDK